VTTHSPQSDGPVTLASPADFSRLSTGWPSPAEQHLESLNLHRALITHPSATYLLRVAGTSMTPRVQPGDIVIVDRSLPARHNDVVVVISGPDFALKRYQRQGLDILLVPDNPLFDAIELTADTEVVVWGVVTYVIAQPRVR